MKSILTLVVLLFSMSVFAQDDRSGECGVSEEKKTIEVLHFFASAVLTNEGLAYIEGVRSALNPENKEYYSCDDVQEIIQDTTSGLKLVFTGLAKTFGMSNAANYAIDMYCEHTADDSICETNLDDDATTMYILTDSELKSNLEKALN